MTAPFVTMINAGDESGANGPPTAEVVEPTEKFIEEMATAVVILAAVELYASSK